MPKWDLAFEGEPEEMAPFTWALHDSGPIEAATEEEAREKFKALAPVIFDYYPCWIVRAEG